MLMTWRWTMFQYEACRRLYNLYSNDRLCLR